MVLEKTAPLEYGGDMAGDVGACYFSRPMLGKHMCFDGRYLHAAPSDLRSQLWPSVTADRGGAGAGEKRRVTFLVNIWLNHKPLAAEPPEDAVLERMRARGPVPVRLAVVRAPRAVQVGGQGEGAAREVVWEFRGEGRGRYSVIVPVPVTPMPEEDDAVCVQCSGGEAKGPRVERAVSRKRARGAEEGQDGDGRYKAGSSAGQAEGESGESSTEDDSDDDEDSQASGSEEEDDEGDGEDSEEN
jgi:hypothetical protein